MDKTSSSAAQRYDDLAPLRDRYLRRAYEYAKVTIPTLLPPFGVRNGDIPETYQGFGARAVTSLSSRLMNAMLPTGVKIAKLGVPPNVLRKIGQESIPRDMERHLTMAEDDIHREIATNGWRSVTYVALQHLIVVGNVMEQMLPDNRIKTFRLDQYVVVRDTSGRQIEFVIKEDMNQATLPEKLRALVDSHTLSQHAPNTQEDTIPLYTWGKWSPDNGGVWSIHQELNGHVVPGSNGEYEISPFNALRWVGVIGEDYGRSKIEEHFGDLRAIEGLSKDMIDGSAMAARHVILVKPNASGGLNLKRRISKANNGDILVGDAEEVGMIKFENSSGLQITQSELAALRNEIAQSFLMNAGVQRDAERVTAFEFRKMIEELESVLGGVYSTLVEEMQSHRMDRLIFQMQRQNKLPPWPNGLIEPTILTGVEALGRERDIERIQTAANITNTLPPRVVEAYLKWDRILSKLYDGLQLSDVVRSDAEAQQNLQQLAQLDAMSKGNMGGEGPAQAEQAAQ